MKYSLTLAGVIFLAVAAIGVWAPAHDDTRSDDTRSDETSASKESQQPQFAEADIEFFSEKIRPLLEKHCFECHGGGEKIRGGLNLTHREGLLEGGDSGPSVDFEDVDVSLLMESINYEGYEMPPDGMLPEEERKLIHEWISRGLPWTPGDEGKQANEEHGLEPPVNDETKKFWSFQPVVRPNPPAVSQEAWIRQPIDRFVLARLESNGLTPVPEASKRELIRRAYYDLTGLPPTYAEVAAFLADDSPDAWEKLIDRLLESPHYGEKWGRHWLDLVRYAETNSYERDGAKPYVWRYRDYVIRSLNEDKPYDQFIREQLAGDELEEVTPETIIATGYYRLGRWDDEPVSQLQAYYDDLDDILKTTTQGMLGLTVDCARCHNHKIDPVPQADYYRLLAFFENIERYGVRGHDTVLRQSTREIASDEERRAQQEEIASHNARKEEVQKAMAAIEKLAKEDFIPVEHEEFKAEMNRVPLIRKRVGTLITQQQFEEYQTLTQEQKRLERFRPTALAAALCVKEKDQDPPESFVLIRGNATAKGDPVEPGFPSVLSPPEPEIVPPAHGNSSGRRLALANWIASSNNPLFARVAVNRIWQHHFGRGIVRSSNDFGFQGTPPTHPLLLDWLASEFEAGGWRLKRMHKLIMLSSTYRRSSRLNEQAMEVDPANNLLWRFDMRRLAAEEIRDSMLAINGSLNAESMYGPSIYTVIPQEVLDGQSRPGSGWGRSSPEDQRRRSIYIHVKRSLIEPTLEVFDFADTDSSCPVRFATTQPTQALALLNSDFVNRQGAVFAKYLAEQAPDDVGLQVEIALRRVLQREPTPAEIARGVTLIEEMMAIDEVSPEQAMINYCVVTFNLNEFLYLD